MATSDKLREYDAALRSKYGAVAVVGVDEAGRGAWAGPMAAGACILPADADIPGLNDSKKLTAEAREALAVKIKAIALGWSVQFIEPTEIDEKGLTWVNGELMRRAAVGALASAYGAEGEWPKTIYVLDQFGQREYSPANLLKPYIMAPKMDGTSLACAAASVLCKTTRDAYMVGLSSKYPKYQLDDHKGYVNPAHRDAVKKHGLVRGLHRVTYQVTGVTKPTQITLLDME